MLTTEYISHQFAAGNLQHYNVVHSVELFIYFVSEQNISMEATQQYLLFLPDLHLLRKYSCGSIYLRLECKHRQPCSASLLKRLFELKDICPLFLFN